MHGGGGDSQKRRSKKKPEFLNSTKQPFDWDYNEIEVDDGLIEDKVIHPEIPTNMPGVYLEVKQTM